MRTLTILTAFAVVLAAGCNQDKITAFIPGTYVNQASGEYSTAYDTLVIEQADAKSNNYIIHRKTAFRRITNGRPGKREYETEEWHAVYDEGTKSMIENSSGKVLTFYPESSHLTLGRREYQKID